MLLDGAGSKMIELSSRIMLAVDVANEPRFCGGVPEQYRVKESVSLPILGIVYHWLGSL